MSESFFNKDLRKKLESIARIQVYRVESHGTSPGIPDNHYICRDSGISGWIEMKEEESMPFRIDYRPAQTPWLIQYAKNGGRCFTAVHIRSSNRLLLIPGRYSQLAAANLRLALHWTFSLDSPNVWSSLAGILRASASLPPPDPRIPTSLTTGLDGETASEG